MKKLIEIIKTDKASGLIKGQIKSLDTPLALRLIKRKFAKSLKEKETKK